MECSELCHCKRQSNPDCCALESSGAAQGTAVGVAGGLSLRLRAAAGWRWCTLVRVCGGRVATGVARNTVCGKDLHDPCSVGGMVRCRNLVKAVFIERVTTGDTAPTSDAHSRQIRSDFAQIFANSRRIRGSSRLGLHGFAKDSRKFSTHSRQIRASWRRIRGFATHSRIRASSRKFATGSRGFATDSRKVRAEFARIRDRFTQVRHGFATGSHKFGQVRKGLRRI